MIRNDKFGAKTLMEYGNNITTKYSYNPKTLRLDTALIKNGNNNYNRMTYNYDSVGNVTIINTINYLNGLQHFSSDQYFEYDTANQLIHASGNDGNLYEVEMDYGKYGKINTSNTRFTDPQNPNPQTFNNTYSYPSSSNSFAPASANNGDIQFEFGINGSMKKRITPSKTEYYHFNAFEQMKAYSDNGAKYGYYGYDDGGQRTYKVLLNMYSSNTNVYPNIKNLEVENMMLYPNGYINITQDGNYTKHYYAEEARIASKIGNGCNEPITYNTSNQETTSKLNVMKNELGTSLTGDIVDNISLPLNWNTITHLQGSGQNVREDGLYFYSGNHLSSTQMITDITGNISQAILYTPFGEIISEYNSAWNQDIIPNFTFSAMEKDEESGMYYFGARYYASPTFITPDPLFEKKPWISRYAYCSNNPVNRVDPTGMLDDEWDVDLQTGRFTWVSDKGHEDCMDYYNICVPNDSETENMYTISMERTDATINSFRIEETENSTISAFHIPETEQSGFFLEPKGPSTTQANQNQRIPEGTYNLENYTSTKFPNVFRVYNDDVSQERKILIHVGNYPKNTSGCLLPGVTKGTDYVGSSTSKLNNIRSFFNGKDMSNARLNIYNVIR